MQRPVYYAVGVNIGLSGDYALSAPFSEIALSFISDYKVDSMPELSFYLNGRYVYCQYYASDGRLQESVGLKVDPEEYRAGKLTKAQKARIKTLESLILRYEGNAMQAGRRTEIAEIRTIILEETGRIKKVNNKGTFLQLIERYIEEVKAGRILNEGEEYSDSWVSVAKAVKCFVEKSIPDVCPEKLTEEHVRRFCVGVTDAGKAKNTVNLYRSIFLSILNGARKMKWFKGQPLEASAARAVAEKIDHGVYLRREEMDLISSLKVTGQLKASRDAFILGCWLGLRHSDLIRLTPENRKGDMVNINTKKTGTPVWVPLSPAAKELWDHLGGRVTLARASTFRDHIKDLGEQAGLTDPVLFKRTEGGKKVEKWVPKHQLLGTHTMRRSFATNAYKAGVPMPSIMKVTGHKSTASFMKYIRLNDEEHAAMLLEHPYFQ